MAAQYDEFGNRRRARKKGSRSGKKRKPKKKNYTGLIIVVSIVGVFSVIGLGAMLVFNRVVAPKMEEILSEASGAEKRSHSKQELKKLGFASHNFHDAQNHFPASLPIDSGSATHSWMTHMLPFVEQPSLYNNVDKNSNWNAPVNAKVFQTTVPRYLNPAMKKSTLSNGYAAAHFSGNSHIFTASDPIRIRDIRDGTSNTIMLGTIASSFPAWGDPANSRDLANGIGLGPNQFGAGDGTFAMITLCDGSTREISADSDMLILKALSTPAGGEDLGSF